MTEEITDCELLADLDATLLLSSAIGSLELLLDRCHPNSRRWNKLDKAMSALNECLGCYRRSQQYDLVRVGHRFFARMQSELDILRAEGYKKVSGKILIQSEEAGGV